MQVDKSTNQKWRRGALVALGLLTLCSLAIGAVLREGLGRASAPDYCCGPAEPEAVPSPKVTKVSTDGAVRFTGQLDRSRVLQGGDGLVRMELQLAADQHAKGRQATALPTDIVVILDRSGSMAGSRLAAAQRAVTELIGRLAPSDRLALITYDTTATTSIPLAYATDSNRYSWREVVQGTVTGGGTDISAGLDLGLMTLGAPDPERARRVLLLSDGHANAGDTSVTGLEARVARALPGQYVVSTIGVGEGFNEELMGHLADRGTGNYYYLDEATDLSAILRQELDASRETVASALTIRVKPAAGVTIEDAGGYPLSREGADTVFHPGSLFAGQDRRVWLSLRLPTTGTADRKLGGLALEFTRDGERQSLELADVPKVAIVQAERDYYAGFDPTRWGASVARESYNSVQAETAALVRQGDRAGALARLDTWKKTQAQINEHVQSAEVPAAIQKADALEAEIQEAFTGSGQASKQNLFSKRHHADAIKGRRMGSYRGSSAH